MRNGRDRGFQQGSPSESQIAVGVMLALFLGIWSIPVGGQPHPATPLSGSSRAVCDCPYAGDPDTVWMWFNVEDWYTCWNVAVNGTQPIQDPLCPVSRSDFSGDGQVDAFDVYLYTLTPLDMEPCQPCAQTCTGLTPVPATPANSVTIESKQVLAGGSGQTVAVRLSNSAYTRGVVIPLQLREITPGAFPTALRVSIADRFIPIDPEFLSVHQYALADGQCGGSGGTGYATISSFNDQIISYPVTGPSWGVLVAGVWMGFLGSALAPGSDSQGSIQLTMSVANTTGSFEIDTACTDPANHLLFVKSTWEVMVPSFTKGTIEVVNCLCPFQGDVDGNGIMDVFDIISMLHVVFESGPAIQDPGCPTARVDYNFDRVFDVFDVIALIEGVFSSGAPPVDPCV